MRLFFGAGGHSSENKVLLGDPFARCKCMRIFLGAGVQSSENKVLLVDPFARRKCMRFFLGAQVRSSRKKSRGFGGCPSKDAFFLLLIGLPGLPGVFRCNC